MEGYKYKVGDRVRAEHGLVGTITEAFIDGQIGDKYPSYTVALDQPIFCGEHQPPHRCDFQVWVEEAIVGRD